MTAATTDSTEAVNETNDAPAETKTDVLTLHEQFAAIRNEIDQTLVERTVEADLIVRQLLARVHGVYLGTWGVGKSMLIRELLKRTTDAQLFETLLVKNSPAEQVVGPVSLKALENDEFRRITTGKLPEANIAFIDEIFKSNATVLNNLLGIINERVFHNNGTPTPLPHFWVVYGASNELPVEQREELGAFYDRLAIRKVVDPVSSSAGIKDVLRGQIARDTGKAKTKVTQVTVADVEQAQEDVAAIDVPEKVLDTLVELQSRAKNEGLEFSLRRMGEGVKLMKAAAWMRGATAVAPEDARVFEHLMWDDPEDHKVAYELTLEFAGSVAKKANQIRGEYEEVRSELHALQSQMPTDGTAPSGDLVGSIGRVSVMFKTLDKRVKQQIENSRDDGLDTHELDSLAEQIGHSRESLNEMLGIGV